MNYVGIDIGGTTVKIAVISGGGKIIEKSSIKTLSTRPADEVLVDIANEVNRITKGIKYEAIGCGCPGAVNSKTGYVEYANNLYWKDVPLSPRLSELTGKVVKITNDANAAALGEAKFGAAKQYTDSAFITLGTGVGGGFVVNGRLYEGFNSMGAEIGHMVIRQNGIQCSCGRKGCLEAYASATGLIRDTIQEMHVDKNSKMWEFVGGDLNKVDGRTSFECSKMGDQSAQNVVDRFVTALAEGILNIVNLFRSQAVIIGGGVSAQGDYLGNPLQEYVDKYRYGGADSLRTVVLMAELGNDAGVLGAASLVINEK